MFSAEKCSKPAQRHQFLFLNLFWVFSLASDAIALEKGNPSESDDSHFHSSLLLNPAFEFYQQIQLYFPSSLFNIIKYNCIHLNDSLLSLAKLSCLSILTKNSSLNF